MASYDAATISIILNYVYRAGEEDANPPASYVLQLFNGDPLGAGTEVAGVSYAEEVIAFEQSGGGSSTAGGDLQNTAQIDFVCPEDEDWDIVNYAAAVDDQARVVGSGALSAPVDLNPSHPETTIRFAIASVVASVT